MEKKENTLFVEYRRVSHIRLTDRSRQRYVGKTEKYPPMETTRFPLKTGPSNNKPWNTYFLFILFCLIHRPSVYIILFKFQLNISVHKYTKKISFSQVYVKKSTKVTLGTWVCSNVGYRPYILCNPQSCTWSLKTFLLSRVFYRSYIVSTSISCPLWL